MTVKRITICGGCRKRIHKTRIGAWYHDKTCSEFCNWPNGTVDRRKAWPLEIEVARWRSSIAC
jgi:hypothetical protein